VTVDLATLNRWKDQPAKFVGDLFGVTPDGWQDEVWAERDR
jgi:hypothetical protein